MRLDTVTLIGALVAGMMAACILPREGTLEPASGAGASGVSVGGSNPVGGSGGVSVNGVGGGGAPSSCSGICVFEPAVGGELVVTRDTTTCPTGWETELTVYDGTDPGCPTCSCNNTVEGGGCLADVVVERFDDNACMMLRDTKQITPGNCVNVPANPGQEADSMRVTPQVTQGACTSTTPPPAAVVDTTICQNTMQRSDGCSNGKICVPDPSPVAVCVLLDGDVECNVNYPNKTLFHDDSTDNRICECTCPASGGNCNTNFQLFDEDSSCTTQFGGPQPAAGSCVDVSGIAGYDSYNVKPLPPFMPGSCSGVGNSSGQVDFTGPKTVCCPDP